MAALEREVQQLRVHLERERLERRNKDEYDALAAEITKLPSRRDLGR